MELHTAVGTKASSMPLASWCLPILQAGIPIAFNSSGRFYDEMLDNSAGFAWCFV
jgi:hypothetical protein